jgi:hypothetical protein
MKFDCETQKPMFRERKDEFFFPSDLVCAWGWGCHVESGLFRKNLTLLRVLLFREFASLKQSNLLLPGESLCMGAVAFEQKVQNLSQLL